MNRHNYTKRSIESHELHGVRYNSINQDNTLRHIEQYYILEPLMRFSGLKAIKWIPIKNRDIWAT